MQAAVLTAPGRPLEVTDLELAGPKAGEVQVRLGASGVCGSDLHGLSGDWDIPTPIVLGHEGAGVVEAIGEGVRDVAVGDHVVLSWYYPCRRCRQCLTGRAWACVNTRSGECVLDDGTTRFSRNGTDVYSYLAVASFAERTVVPESAAVKIPDDVPFEIASLIGCSVTTGVGAVVNNAKVEAGAAVVVVGCGGVGLCTIMGAKLVGAHPIIAVDLEPSKLELARELGATHTVRGDADVVAEVAKITGGGADYAFEAIGAVPTIELLPDLLTTAGVGVIVGLPAMGKRPSFDALSFAEAGKTLIGSNYGGAIPSVDFLRFAELYLAGDLPVDRIVEAKIGLEGINDAFEAMRRRERARSVIVY